ncbi:P-loop containing protein [Fusarium sp. NRRL 52700]|nr:P-loop containing protein [Fusarium sp. NRRL 52700]
MAPKSKKLNACKFNDKAFEAHMGLLSLNEVSDGLDDVSLAPMFTGHVGKHQVDLKRESSGRVDIPDQYGLLGRDLSKDQTSADDPRVFYNVAAPSSTFICGSQGSGKSHTLATLLENCLVQSEANLLPRPLTGLVFHYDTFISDAGGLPCEAAHLSSHPGIKVRVFCPPTNVTNLKRIYSTMPNVSVQELRLGQADLNTKRMLDLMAVNSGQNGRMPLYLHVVARVLRESRIQQQKLGGTFDYHGFKRALEAENLTESQSIPLQQRLETLESFMAKEESRVSGVATQGSKKKKNKAGAFGGGPSDWTPVSGQLTVVDLSCPCVTPEMACSLFNVCLGLFLEQETSLGKVVALDESHKYMTDNVESQAFTESLLSTIRLQRHLGVRVIVSTQEPTVSTRLLDLCSMTIVHRFTSPDWLQVLKRHLAGGLDLSELNEKDGCEGQQQQQGETGQTKDANVVVYPAMSPLRLFSNVVQLRTGEALLFSPSAVVDTVRTAYPSGTGDAKVGWQAVFLGRGVMKVRVRDRITNDGGRSVMA